ncbi:uncharacterized protein LOC115747695 isoform X1 [Rhodamnia argentea]|uniref:Uncharacterized protein LOC115747695 isoform X1 n=1 Tax=Rhodamnia argentea TaxID=178133 RepID=A0A8B8PYD5_9MYRT|nr:uncharacterized protein LOC115747695 isoform X1 [Rhodamnia argentea]
MSFLAARLAGKEGAYFFEESKHAVNRLAQKAQPLNKNAAANGGNSISREAEADVLPEVLRHSLPSRIYSQRSDPSSSSSSSLSKASKWALRWDPESGGSAVSSDALNPLRAHLAMPQVTFGPNRWKLPPAGSSVLASTANELRQDRYTHANPEKLKAAADGLANVGKAFAAATVIVFGSASIIFGLVASKLQVQNGGDIYVKVRDLAQPTYGTVREQVAPLRTWVENMSRKWRIEREDDIKQKPMMKELSRTFGMRTSN